MVVSISGSPYILIWKDPYRPSFSIIVLIDKRLNVGTIAESYKYDLSKANLLLLYQVLCNCDWPDVLSCNDIKCLNYFYSQMYRCLDTSVPRHNMKWTSKGNIFPPWFSISLILKIWTKISYIMKYSKMIQTPLLTEFTTLQ